MKIIVFNLVISLCYFDNFVILCENIFRKNSDKEVGVKEKEYKEDVKEKEKEVKEGDNEKKLKHEDINETDVKKQRLNCD